MSYDPSDPRYSNPGYGYSDVTNNAGSYYPQDLEIDNFSDSASYVSTPAVPCKSTRPAPPDPVNVLTRVLDQAGYQNGPPNNLLSSFADIFSIGSSSGRWDSRESGGLGTSRGGVSTEYTDPDMGASRFVPTGPRCIFHWTNCQERFADPAEWSRHVDSHLPPPHPSQPRLRRDFVGMPYDWTCGFPYCGFSIGNEADHERMWDAKIGHIFEYHLSKGAKPEDNRELEAWMRYYQKLHLCSESDATGHINHPPVYQPYYSGKIEPRRNKRDKKDSRHSPLPPGQPIAPPPPQMQQFPSPGATGDHAPPVHEQQFSRPGSYIAAEFVRHQQQPPYQADSQVPPEYQPAPYGPPHPPAYAGHDAYPPGHMHNMYPAGPMYPPHGQPVQPVEQYPGHPY
ncbi:hypothetical protein Dda_2073 [Drechslerella dactyloides]|uniref:Uncharacterized protein n=1 Tax=Drechslerella dactyloides TaxID=74499 RepID=A0AAD6J4N5_DREDA|nr:hypothetical protein Dda_2073 [Drechslerella dactyloides]